MEKMKQAKLKELVKHSETSERILRMIADRRRNTVYTAFSGLRADLKNRDQKPVDKKDFNKTFEALEAIGAGHIDKTQRGTYRGFLWKEQIRNVGQALKTKDVPPQVENGKTKPKDSNMVTLIVVRENEPPRQIQIDESKLKELSL